MASSIGLRVYRVSIRNENGNSDLSFDIDGGDRDLYSFLKKFVAANGQTHNRADLQRSLFFDEKNSNSESVICGYIRYGTYGFESNMIDYKTKNNNYTRKTTDIEEIPLYFHFYIPRSGKFGLIAFQSFQARSCVTIVFGMISDYFLKLKSENKLVYKKLMPNDVKNSLFYSSPVKGFTFIKKNLPKDKADAYLKNIEPAEVNVELSIKSKRNGILGTLKDFMPKNSAAGGQLLVYDGIEFDEAKAEIFFGGRRRTVGIIGYSSDAGVVDITDAINLGPDGHPTFESIKKETETIIVDFFKSMTSN